MTPKTKYIFHDSILTQKHIVILMTHERSRSRSNRTIPATNGTRLPIAAEYRDSQQRGPSVTTPAREVPKHELYPLSHVMFASRAEKIYIQLNGDVTGTGDLKVHYLLVDTSDTIHICTALY